MEVIYGLKGIRKFRNAVVALGVFDGVHLGHRKILKAAAAEARRIKGASVVVTFWPDPHHEQSIYSLKHRLKLIGELGIDACVVIRFSKSFASMSAQRFIAEVLARRLGCRRVYVGRNFRFGKRGKGDVRSLSRLSSESGFRVRAFEVLAMRGSPVSSTYIRSLIRKGDLALASRLLARPVSVLGTVIKGASFARRLGFPTANIDPHHEVLPPAGVYAVSVAFSGRSLSGVCYIGRKPSFVPHRPGRADKQNIEVHIFGFRRKIYGKELEVRFVKRIGTAKRFKSSSALLAYIQKCVILAKQQFPSR